MRRARLIACLTATASLFAGRAVAAPPAAFRITDLGSLGGGQTYASDLNEAGQVTGMSGGLAYLWSASTGMRSLGTFAGGSTSFGVGL